MKITFVSGRLYPWSYGGSTVATFHLASAVSRFTQNKVALWGTVPRNSDLSVIRATYPSTLNASPFRTFGENNSLSDVVESHAKYFQKMLIERSNLVHFTILPGLRAAAVARIGKLIRAKLVLTMYDFPPYEAMSYSSNTFQTLAALVHWACSLPNLGIFDAVITNSSMIRDAALKAGVPKERLVVLPLGIDVSEFPSDALSNNQAGSYILCFGPFFPKKGQHRLIQAYAASDCKRNVRLLLIGKGSEYRNYCMRLSKELGIDQNTTFLNPPPREHLLQIIRQSSVCVFPSDYEGFGLSVLEAMACGKAVITTSFGGPSHYIENGIDGILVNPTKIDIISNSMDNVLSDVELNRKIGMAARTTAMRYDWNLVADRYVKFYQRL